MERERHVEEERSSHTRSYFLVYLALLLLLGATVGAAYIDIGPLNLVLALAIATLKAGLVLVFFMHIRESSGLVRFFALAGLIWLVILVGLTLSDYLTRLDPFSL